jgi:hypothetical protein
MKVNFIVIGRLGNAIFRYLASAILCIHYNAEYILTIKPPENNINIDEVAFLKIIDGLTNSNESNNTTNKIKINNSVNMVGYYQHDLIYSNNKQQIIDFVKSHPEHYILTDGFKAGDGNYEKFFVKDIFCTPTDFNKIYKTVLHIRLEDFVTLDLFLPVQRITYLLTEIINNNEQNLDKICIVCNKIETKFEKIYMSTLTHFLDVNNIEYVIESNDVLTDYYIMKEAELLICSKSTLSWCAALLSDKIKKCYLPNYKVTPNSSCKFPIKNTFLY